MSREKEVQCASHACMESADLFHFSSVKTPRWPLVRLRHSWIVCPKYASFSWHSLQIHMYITCFDLQLRWQGFRTNWSLMTIFCLSFQSTISMIFIDLSFPSSKRMKNIEITWAQTFRFPISMIFIRIGEFARTLNPNILTPNPNIRFQRFFGFDFAISIFWFRFFDFCHPKKTCPYVMTSDVRLQCSTKSKPYCIKRKLAIGRWSRHALYHWNERYFFFTQIEGIQIFGWIFHWP